MNRIDEKFKDLKKAGRKAFIAYISAGDPTAKITEAFVPALEKAGVDILELGVPFSDPMADGPTNQRAAERALRHNITLEDILRVIKNARQKSSIPIVLFTYFNPVFRYGVEKFAKDAGRAGVDGVLILDLPVEESGEYRRIIASYGLKIIYLLAPTSNDKRIRLICRNASGFIYYVSRTGVTGMRDAVENDVNSMVIKIKWHTHLPVVVGFGISKPSHVREVAKYADGVVVGSAIVKRIEDNIGSPFLVSRTCRFVRSLTRVL